LPRRPIGAAAVTAGALLLSGCTLLAPADPRLCAATQNLSAAMALTATAIAADDAGDFARAQGLATQARSLTERSLDLLQGVPDDRHADDAWQRLLEAYGHAGQAANSLLPAYADRHGTGPEELELAGRSMDAARGDVPAMCFSIPADLETPGAS
jgi:hypothetical protein